MLVALVSDVAPPCVAAWRFIAHGSDDRAGSPCSLSDSSSSCAITSSCRPSRIARTRAVAAAATVRGRAGRDAARVESAGDARARLSDLGLFGTRRPSSDRPGRAAPTRRPTRWRARTPSRIESGERSCTPSRCLSTVGSRRPSSPSASPRLRTLMQSRTTLVGTLRRVVTDPGRRLLAHFGWPADELVVRSNR